MAIVFGDCVFHVSGTPIVLAEGVEYQIQNIVDQEGGANFQNVLNFIKKNGGGSKGLKKLIRPYFFYLILGKFQFIDFSNKMLTNL